MAVSIRRTTCCCGSLPERVGQVSPRRVQKKAEKPEWLRVAEEFEASG